MKAIEIIKALESATEKLLSELKHRDATPQEAAAILTLCKKLANLPGVVPEE